VPIRSLLLCLCLLLLHACDAATPVHATADAGPACTGADAATADVVGPVAGPKSMKTIPTWADFDALADVSQSDAGPVHSVKFLILDAMAADPKVYFIGRRYALHYDFGHELLPELFPTRGIFDQLVYASHTKHPHVVGTLLWYEQLTVPPGRLPQGAHAPVGLWFFPTDDLPFELILKTYQLVLARVTMLPTAGNEQRLVYTPSSGTLEAQALANDATLTQAGVPWLGQADLLANVQQQAMNVGVTFGTLRAVAWDKLKAGTVSYRDVIVLDRLPLDLPLVGGTITEELQTPLAHVNVAAKTRGTPNLALRKALTDPRVAPLLGKPVRFEVKPGGWDLRAATPQEVDDYWTQKQACRLNFHPQADLTVRGVRDMEAEHRGHADSVRFGVKASNYAALHQAFLDYAKIRPGFIALLNKGLDTFTPASLGVPFGDYEDHLHRSPVIAQDCADMAADCAKAEDVDAAACTSAQAVCQAVVAKTKPADLKAYIHTMLQRTDFKADSPLRAALLHGFRWKIEHTAVDPSFGAGLDAMITQKFGATTPVRLRSSTNAEDLEGFTGAGLYESFTAYGSGDKRASVRIVKVWGSVWTFRAFEERSFWNIAHEDVYMGVEINRSFPNEKSNGVLITRDLIRPDSWGFYLNAQKGEESVTNPTQGITPEVATVIWSYLPPACDVTLCTAKTPACSEYNPACEGKFVPAVSRFAWSSLSPDVPVVTDEEIGVLIQAVLIAQDALAPQYGKTPATLAFDLEWKVDADDGRVYLKQIRPF
jgi:pyruvate,water dikinase